MIKVQRATEENQPLKRFCSLETSNRGALDFTVSINVPDKPSAILDGCMLWDFHAALCQAQLLEELSSKPLLRIQCQPTAKERICNANKLIEELDFNMRNSEPISFAAEACRTSNGLWEQEAIEEMAEALTAYMFGYSPTGAKNAHNPFDNRCLLFINCNEYYNATIARSI